MTKSTLFKKESNFFQNFSNSINFYKKIVFVMNFSLQSIHKNLRKIHKIYKKKFIEFCSGVNFGTLFAVCDLHSLGGESFRSVAQKVSPHKKGFIMRRLYTKVLFSADISLANFATQNANLNAKVQKQIVPPPPPLKYTSEC